MNDCKYIRVGTQYYKIVRVPSLTGEYSEERIIPWKSETIRHDEGSNFMNFLMKFQSMMDFVLFNSLKLNIGNQNY